MSDFEVPARTPARYLVMCESMCSSLIRRTAVIGTASTMPVMPHSAAHTISEQRITTGDKSSVFPNRYGSSTLPASACAAPGTRNATSTWARLKSGSSKTMGIGRAMAKTVPMTGTKLSQKPRMAKTSQSSSPMAASAAAVTTPTKNETLTFALMYAWMALLAAPFLARGPLRTPLGGVAPLAPPCSPRASSSGAAVVTSSGRVSKSSSAADGADPTRR
mmetsp:Transcript_12374/g.36473  ORF Transcript_12374/g.36473 Transcript_12374/m.36473 type:complete len:219 (+) Transcript_12374:162-818(+)